MVLMVLAVLGGLAVILVAAVLFTNAVEWLGHKLRLKEGVVGSVIAAVGTALPETIVPIVAVLLIGEAAHGTDVGLGAILGAPFMLSTLAMLLIGLSILVFSTTGGRPQRLQINRRVLARDLGFFLGCYTAAMALAFVPWRAAKVTAAPLLLATYGLYVYLHAVDPLERQEPAELEPLHFHPRAEHPHLALVLLQVAFSLALVVGGATWFVGSLGALAQSLGVSPVVLSVLVTPVATELPEKVNSILWVRVKKDTLALGNVTGAMVFQSTWPVSFGLLFTEWTANPEHLPGFVSGVIALLTAGTIMGVMVKRRALTARHLLLGGVGYLAYIWYIAVVWA